MIGIFLSSTFRDFTDYRDEISDALRDELQVGVVKLEDAAGSYVDVVKLCEHELRRADGFLLLFAHWYGSIPEKLQKSITHLEFEWARERWKHLSSPPMAVLMPEKGSDADRELSTVATELIKREQDTGYRAKHQSLVDDFQKELETGGRIMLFPTRERAVRKALVACRDWQGNTPVRAALRYNARAFGDGPELVTDVSLGSLGRQKQDSALKKELARLDLSVESPGAAILVSGDEHAGQLEFLAFLTGTGRLPGRPAGVALLPTSPYPAPDLPSWIGERLGFGGGERSETIAALAASLADQLEKQSLSVVLGNIEPVQGGVVAFQEQFWLPLYRELTTLKEKYGFENRLLVIAALHERLPSSDLKSVHKHSAAKEPPDYERLLLLPELGRIHQDDLTLWLADNQVSKRQRAGDVKEVMREQKSLDANEAFGRLRRRSFQFEEEDAG